ncbi:hypothetical protein Tco_0367702 [Tanacetum coccineum]
MTVCTTRLRGQFHTILEDIDHYSNACLEELEAFLTLWDVKPRVEESSLETLSVDELITQLRQVCEDAEDHVSNAQEEARQKRKEALEEVNLYSGLATLQTGSRVKFAYLAYLTRLVLNWWNVNVRSVTTRYSSCNPLSDFKAMVLSEDTALGNDIKQMKTVMELKSERHNLTANNQTVFHELILLSPEMYPIPRPVFGDVTLMVYLCTIKVVQELGENSGDKRKWNGNHYNPNNTNNLNPNKCPETTRVFTAGQGSYAGKLPYCRKCRRYHTNACPPTFHNCGRAGHKAKDCRAPPRPASQRGPGSQGDREVMLLVSDVVRRDITRTSVQTMEVKAVETKSEATNKILRTIRGRIKETLKEITKHQPDTRRTQRLQSISLCAEAFASER